MTNVEYHEALRRTADSIWSSLPIREKQEALQAIEGHIAAFEGRAERTILVENMPDGYFGYYNHEDPEHIHISPYALRTPNDAVETVLHEGRHAYQHDCLDRNEGFPQPILEQMRDGFENYVSPEENFKAYAENFTEMDAERFAQQQSRLLAVEREALTQAADGHLPPEAQARAEQPAQMWEPGANEGPGYDWANQTTFPELGREKEKTMGGSETETIVESLRDREMSTEDFRQYYQYFFSEAVSQQPEEYQLGLAGCLKNMTTAVANGDSHEYYQARDRFLDIDAYCRDNVQRENEEPSVSSHLNDAEAPDMRPKEFEEQRDAPEMNMNPGASAEQTEPEMNMAPSAIERGGYDESREYAPSEEMGAVPRSGTEDNREYESESVSQEPEMNMAPSAIERGGYDESWGSAPSEDMGAAPRSGAEETRESERESVSQEPEMNMAPSAIEHGGYNESREPAPSEEMGAAPRSGAEDNREYEREAVSQEPEMSW